MDFNFVLEYTNIVKKYGNKEALSDVSLKLPKSSVVGLLGPNGSGKTTLLKLAAGLLCPSSGSVKACGKEIGKETKSLIAYQPDCVYLNNWMNVGQLVAMMADFYENFSVEKAYLMLDRLKISKEDKLKTLSKGTKEKVQLILTMSRDVPLYILDEPIGGVDPAARDYILETIIQGRSPKSTVLISTHLITDIESILNNIIFLKEGRIVREGNAEEIRKESGKSIDQLFREEFRC